MKKLSVLSAISVLVLVPPAGRSDENGKGNPPQLADLIFDAAAFGSALPKKTLIYATSAENQAQVRAGIKALGLLPEVEFFQLPSAAKVPEIKNQVTPTYPKGIEGSGEASLLVIISASGRVSSIYCWQATNKAFALSAADAVARWTFSPAKVQKTAVPVLFAMPIHFDRN